MVALGKDRPADAVIIAPTAFSAALTESEAKERRVSGFQGRYGVPAYQPVQDVVVLGHGSNICPTNTRRGVLGFLRIKASGEQPKCSTKGSFPSFLAHFLRLTAVAG